MLNKISIILLLVAVIYVAVNLNQQEKFIILQKNHIPRQFNNKTLKIPCKIWQTHKSNDLPESSYKNIMNMIKINKGFEYNFYDDNDMKRYMEMNFDRRVNDAYNKIKPGAGKADIWRLAVILNEGGIYIDVDKIPTDKAVSFADLIDPDDEMIHGRNWHIWGYDAPATNATLCARPNHPVIKRAFESVIDSILNDKPLNKMGKHSGWAKLECYTGTPHLWKAISEHTGIINMKEGKYKNGLVISNKIENVLGQNPNYGNDLEELKVTHWSKMDVFN